MDRHPGSSTPLHDRGVLVLRLVSYLVSAVFVTVLGYTLSFYVIGPLGGSRFLIHGGLTGIAVAFAVFGVHFTFNRIEDKLARLSRNSRNHGEMQ